jgi:hydroxypyruvate reductase
VFPSPLVSFILSDVVGDDLSTIGSGPTVPDPTTFQDAWKVLERFSLLDKIPTAVQEHLRRGLKGFLQETPKPGDRVFSNIANILIGSNRLALEAAAETAHSFGFFPHIQEEPLRGDTTTVALQFAAKIKTQRRSMTQPTCLLAGGETTVHVTGMGKGGRNQEFALVVAQALGDESGWALLSAGTDGIDGPTDAAGAFVDSFTIGKAKRKGLDPQQALNNNDSYHFFSALGDLFSPGPTGTNVMDMKIALMHP